MSPTGSPASVLGLGLDLPPSAPSSTSSSSRSSTATATPTGTASTASPGSLLSPAGAAPQLGYSYPSSYYQQHQLVIQRAQQQQQYQQQYQQQQQQQRQFHHHYHQQQQQQFQRHNSSTGTSATAQSTAGSNASFPTHNSPRTWLLTAALSPLAVRLIRLLLAHGDNVVACLPPHEIDHEERGAEFRELIGECKSGRSDREGWRDRIRGIRCDGRTMAGCGAAVAEAVEVFGRIDILLCCKSESVVGTVEELSTTPVARNLVRDQFESVFFSQVNFIKAALPVLRAQHTGHIMVLTSIGGHIATPGLSMYSAATWGLEGFCDSLAYEVAPFNIKVTIVQPNQEIQTLTNRLIFAPPIPAYENAFEAGPNVRDIFAKVLNTDPETAVPPLPSPSPSKSPGHGHTESVASMDSDIDMNLDPDPARGEIFQQYPKLPPGAADRLVAETVHALTAIGGHENPPARHIVGGEGAIAVREKLKTVSEELEDFVDASLAVDIFESELKDEAREGEKGPVEETSN